MPKALREEGRPQILEYLGVIWHYSVVPKSKTPAPRVLAAGFAGRTLTRQCSVSLTLFHFSLLSFMERLVLEVGQQPPTTAKGLLLHPASTQTGGGGLPDRPGLRPAGAVAGLDRAAG